MPTSTQSIREIVTSIHPQPKSFIDSILTCACRPIFRLKERARNCNSPSIKSSKNSPMSEAKERGGVAFGSGNSFSRAPDPTHRPHSSPLCSSRASETRRDGFKGGGEAR